MLGLCLGTLGSIAAVWMSWKSYRQIADPAECSILEHFVRSGVCAAVSAVNSRPHQLLDELRSIGTNGDAQVAAFNDVLNEVDCLTRVGQKAITSLSRAAFFAGMAGATLEVARNTNSLGQTAIWAGSSLSVGLVGAGTCTAIGHRAIRGIGYRRQLWDDFVRRILNSHFPQTELNVPGFHRNQADGGRQPENSKAESGQH